MAVVSAALFGLYPNASRAAYADGASVVFVMLVFVFMRAFLLSSFSLIKGRVLFVTKSDKRDALVTGFWQALTMIGMYFGFFYIEAPVVVIILFSHTLMLLFFMAWKGEIKLNKAILASTVFAFIGLAFVIDLWSVQSASNWIGIGFSFLAAVSTVSRLYVFDRQTKTRNPGVVGAECLILTFILLLPMIFLQSPIPPQTLAGWGWVLGGGLCIGLGTFGMFYGIALMGSFKWSLFLKMEPIFTTLFSAILIHEYLKPSQYLGIALVLVSLVAYQVHDAKVKAASPVT